VSDEKHGGGGGGAGGEARGERPTPFQLLVGGLGAQVQIALGLLPDPTDQSRSTDLESARQGIDMLAALEEKTKGNLTPQEAGLLVGLLTQLRMSYVEQRRPGASS
jgi:hypothetical protein